MRCLRCGSELEPRTLGGLCPVCLLDAALPDEVHNELTDFRYDLVAEIARGGMGVDRAMAEGKRTLELDPNYIYESPVLANVYREKGMYQEAIALFQKAQQITGRPQPGLAITYAITGRTEEARQILGELREIAATKYIAAEEIASVHVALGEKEEAFKWLDRACDDHGGAIHAIPVRPVFKALHSEPRFHENVRRIGLDPALVLGPTTVAR